MHPIVGVQYHPELGARRQRVGIQIVHNYELKIDVERMEADVN